MYNCTKDYQPTFLPIYQPTYNGKQWKWKNKYNLICTHKAVVTTIVTIFSSTRTPLCDPPNFVGSGWQLVAIL